MFKTERPLIYISLFKLKYSQLSGTSRPLNNYGIYGVIKPKIIMKHYFPVGVLINCYNLCERNW